MPISIRRSSLKKKTRDKKSHDTVPLSKKKSKIQYRALLRKIDGSLVDLSHTMLTRYQMITSALASPGPRKYSLQWLKNLKAQRCQWASLEGWITWMRPPGSTKECLG
jgi:hypothetical protein